MSMLELDTGNRFLVTAHQDKVISMVLDRHFTRSEALSLAAWLVSAVDMLETDAQLTARKEFDALYEAIQAT